MEFRGLWETGRVRLANAINVYDMSVSSKSDYFRLLWRDAAGEDRPSKQPIVQVNACRCRGQEITT